MQVDTILSELYAKVSSDFDLDLKRIKVLAEKIENPQKSLKLIHVAGTNAKGSTCEMIYSILKNAGHKVGIYTSPHLQKFNERIRISNKQITDEEIADYYHTLKPHVTNQSFFEITTIMAFKYFKDNNCDYAIIEAGLGGRLDATNIITPLISVITNVGFDHMDYLGNSIEQIATEKAGIIKQNIPVVTAATGIALTIIKNTAKQKNAPLTKAYSFTQHHESFTVKNPVPLTDLSFKYLSGTYLKNNAALAITAVDQLRKGNQVNVTDEHIRAGINNAYIPCRFERIAQNIIIDTAHNPDGFKMLARELEAFSQKKIFLVSFLNDKDIKSMMEIVNSASSYTIITLIDSDRAADPQQIASYSTVQHKIIPDQRQALKLAKEKAKELRALAIITGSFYLVGNYKTQQWKRTSQ